MADSTTTIVLITGIGRGIGKALAEAYLARPYHIVIGSVRDNTAPSVQGLKALPTAAGSRLLLVSIESTSAKDVPKAAKEIEAAGIDHLDLVIANSGICPDLASPDTIDINDITNAFSVNTVGSIRLWQGFGPLLKKSKQSPKWISVSTVTGSVASIDKYKLQGFSAYGISKTGLNWFTVAIHAEHPWLTAFCIHPGLVQTEMGNKGAELLGLAKAPYTLEDSARSTIATIDKATRENSSGKLLNVMDGTEIPW